MKMKDETNNMLQTSVNKDPLTDSSFITMCDYEEKDIDAAKSKSISLPKKEAQTKSIHLSSKQIDADKFSMKQNSPVNEEEKNLLEDTKGYEKLPLTIIKKLQQLRIKLIHAVPQQHQIELTGSHAPTKQMKELFQTYGPLRKGPYSFMEDKIIIKNWKKFCELHNWDSKYAKAFFYWRYKKMYYIKDIKERQKFVQFLANGLPWRTLFSVYNRFKVLYQNKIVHARYTSEDDRKILMYIKNNSLNKHYTKYNELAKLLGRTPHSISKRYRQLKEEFESENKKISKSLKNVKWTLPLIKKFIDTLLSITLSEDVEELKYAIFPKLIWREMEKKINIDKKVLQTFWKNQLHMQLFSTNPIYLNDIKIQLIEYMYIKGISHVRDIRWSNVAQYFEGVTSEFLCKTFFYFVQECNINNMDNFVETVEYMYHKKIPKIKNMPTDKFLPRIIYKNKTISIHEEDNNNMKEIMKD